MAYVENDGVRIHYRVEGEGPPLFLHMGFSVDLTGWYEWGYVDALKDDYRLILIDPRGHGKSDKPHDPAAYQSAHGSVTWSRSWTTSESSEPITSATRWAGGSASRSRNSHRPVCARS